MSVTAEQIEEVAVLVRGWGYSGSADQIAEKAKVARIVESKPGEIVKAANAIRAAYYDDGVLRELLSSRDPVQWLRMAEAALGGRVPRVFNLGDAEPEDRDTITLKSADGQTLGFHDDPDPGNPIAGKRWWMLKHAGGSTYGEWRYWLRYEGPLTEVLA